VTDEQKPAAWRYAINRNQLLTQDPAQVTLARELGRDVEPLYTQAAIAAAVAAERERCARIVEDMVRMVDGSDALAAIRQAPAE
jgi:hypothetical protein